MNLFGSLLNSLIFTAGVVGCTLVFGLLVGYALAVLSFRGRGLVFALVLLVQAIPFQLLMIPLYVMVVRYFGLADNFIGMILPFAINSVAVLIFRQYFLQTPATCSTPHASTEPANCASCSSSRFRSCARPCSRRCS